MQRPENEQELIAQARQGDENAVTHLYETHVDAIFEYISYRVATRTIAEDLTSEVFLRMVRGLAGYEDRGLPFRAWLYRIAGHLVIDHYRQHQRTETTLLAETHASDDDDLLDRVVQYEDQLRLRHAIRGLPETYQNVLILRFVENLSHIEITEIMHKSVDALRALQYRALKALAERLSSGGEEQPSQTGGDL